MLERVLTDNGPCFKRAWDRACAELGVRPKRTPPRRPQTNGKVERLIRTLGEGWAYAGAYTTEGEREQALGPFLDYDNRRRPHRALGGQTPLQRVNNVLGTNTPGSLVGSLLASGVVVQAREEPPQRCSLPAFSSRL